ncbi:MAG TPA: M15 family metallopeptidase [Candidatus Dojkabacteria bacterium]|nr:M15 family metallopeptidase [Candidatus Dojkabacteria bacterium]
MKQKPFTITEEEKELTKSLLKKITETEKEKFSIADLDTVYSFLNKQEIKFLKKLLTINPHDYGIKGEYLGIQDVPEDLVGIKGQRYETDTEEKGYHEIGESYLPRKVYKAYEKMNKAMFNDIGKKLLVRSGYRSPAYQLFLLGWYLNMYDFDVGKTLKRVAMPGYSEHCVADKVAIDFITEDGVPQEEDDRCFEDTQEYKWLLKNAEKFGFKESFPKGNELGTMYEPWHWRYVEK